MYKRILVTLDGSTRAEAVRSHAIAQAQHSWILMCRTPH
jgi:nucleotide-binding universal stress UspA family protein